MKAEDRINTYLLWGGAEKNSSIELLRIIAMVMIVSYHFAIHGDIVFATDRLTINRLWYQLLLMGGKIGSNIFVLISGYFLINMKKINVMKLLRLEGQLIFYSLAIYCLFCLVGLESFSIINLIKSFLPVSNRTWWFASTYVVMYLFIPYINEILRNLKLENYVELLMLTSIIWVLFPTLLSVDLESNDLIWFIYLYSIAAFIRLWSPDQKMKEKPIKFLIIAVELFAITYALTILFDIIGITNHYVAAHATHFYDYNQLPVVLIAVSLFLFFKNIEIKNNKYINMIAATTFGIYLIHDNNFIRSFLWIDLFKNNEVATKNYFIIYSIVIIIFVLIVCFLIELIRNRMIEKKTLKIMAVMGKYIEKQSFYINRSFCSRFDKKL